MFYGAVKVKKERNMIIDMTPKKETSRKLSGTNNKTLTVREYRKSLEAHNLKLIASSIGKTSAAVWFLCIYSSFIIT